MAVILGVFTDKGREWFAKILAGQQLVADAFVLIRHNSLGQPPADESIETSPSAHFSVTGITAGTPYTPGIGGIGVPNGAVIGDGEYFKISIVEPNTFFEFDKNGVVTPGRVPVPITDAMTAPQVAVEVIRAINASGLPITASFTTRTDGINFFRIGEGGFRVLPSLEKVPIAASERKDKNGIQAGKGVKGDLTIDPDDPSSEKIIVPADGGGGSAGEPVVPDRDLSLFFAHKELAPSDMSITLVSGVYRLEVTCKLELNEANKRFNSQGGGNPDFFEIGVFAQEGTERYMIGYGTFPKQTKTNGISLINKVVFEV